MLNDDQMSAGMTAAADQIEAMCAGHERQAHAGGPCPGVRIGAVAYLAHRLGLSSASVPVMTKLVADIRGYEDRCPACREGRTHD